LLIARDGVEAVTVAEQTKPEMLYRRHLEREGFELLIARDGVEAVTVAEQTKPDLILMDIMMPGGDGMAAMRKMREKESLRQVPIIVITANVDYYETSGREAKFGGAAGLLTKPLSPAKLVSEVQRILAGSTNVSKQDTGAAFKTHA
jgi:two-component system alkaline phosphatase synthesis response regulator PhoP